jgi:hypothetical protein
MPPSDTPLTPARARRMRRLHKPVTCADILASLIAQVGPDRVVDYIAVGCIKAKKELHNPIMNPCYDGEHKPEMQRNGEIQCRVCGWYLKMESDDEPGNFHSM